MWESNPQGNGEFQGPRVMTAAPEAGEGGTLVPEEDVAPPWLTKEQTPSPSCRHHPRLQSCLRCPQSKLEVPRRAVLSQQDGGEFWDVGA